MNLFPDYVPHREKVVMRHIFEKQAEEIPNRECILFEEGETWTYSEALAEGYGAANVLRELGVERGENVLIFLPNSQAWIRAWLGITFLGGVIVPVNTALKGEMLRHICMDSQANHMITSTELGGRLKGLDLDLNIIDPSLLAQGSTDAPGLDRAIEPWDTHGIIYTSGTTGPSKGVITPYFQTYCGGLANWGDSATADDTMLGDLPLFHTAGENNVVIMWSLGGRVAFRSAVSVSRYWEITRECGVTLAMMIGTLPTFLSNSPTQSNDADNPVRVMFSAPMVNTPEAFMKRFGVEKIVTTFGMTETTGITHDFGPVPHPRSCGKAIPGVEIRLVDQNDVPIKTGEKGELTLRYNLPWMMNVGYFNRPEETARAWRNGWFHTGDMLTCDEEGNYFFVDRSKDAIRRRGENVSSFEVEREVMAYPDVVEAAAVAAAGEFGEDEVKVFVIPHKGTDFAPADLIHFLIPRMPYFMVPRFVEVVSEFPKTASMRIKKYQLRAKGNSSATWDREAAGIKVSR